MRSIKNNIESPKNWKERMQSMAERNQARDRGFDKYAGKISKFIWPVHEKWLVLFTVILCLLDFTSTYIDLAVIRKPGLVENGLMAGWALSVGGFGFLLIVDILVVSAVLGIATLARYLYMRLGLKGYARAAFVVLLLPYIVRTFIVVINNVINGFR